MAQVVVTLKIMPESPDVDLKQIEVAASREVKTFGGDVGKILVEPIAFGLKAVKILFVMDESIGSTEALENAIQGLSGVQSVQVTDVRRAIG